MGNGQLHRHPRRRPPHAAGGHPDQQPEAGALLALHRDPARRHGHQGHARQHTAIDQGLIGHVVMGMAQHSHRDSIYGAQGMRWRGGLGDDVPALTVARICGSGAEAVAVGAEMILAGVRHDASGPSWSSAAPRACSTRSASTTTAAARSATAVQKYGPVDAKALPPGTHLQDSLLMSLYDPGAGMAMANTAEELGRRYEITRERGRRVRLSLAHERQAGARRRAGSTRRSSRSRSSSTAPSRADRGRARHPHHGRRQPGEDGAPAAGLRAGRHHHRRQRQRRGRRRARPW